MNYSRYLRRKCALAATALAVSGCIGCCAAAAELKVMTYNILAGGGGLGQPLSKTAQVIADSGADIIGLQEQSGSTAALAAMLGFQFHVQNGDISFLSRYPITQSLPSGVRVSLPQGQDAFLFNVHLAAYPYQPYDIRDGLIGTEAQAIVGANAARGAAMANVLNGMSAYLQAGDPVFLVGDFNEPSHLDWTDEAAEAGQNFGLKVAWPTSTQVVNAGLEDTFRAIYPDPVQRRGDTWTPLVSPGEVHDRIDIVYHAGDGVRPIDALVVGENSTQADLVVTPYPSDHRAVVGRYELLNVGGLMVRVDRGNGDVEIRNTSAELIAFDGYSMTSAGGFLDPQNGAWLSLADQGLPGWQEANPDERRLSELSAGAPLTLAAGESFSLGQAYAFRPSEFGQPYVEDVRFRYFRPDGETLVNEVQFTGWRNNLVMLVDPATGETVLENQSAFDVAIDGYRIVSASGSLIAEDGSWMSLADRAIDDWTEANPSDRMLAELNPLGASLIPSGARIQLGSLFDASTGLPDLAFTFLMADEAKTRTGVVLYEPFATGCPEGDANGDCLVDLADLNSVRNSFGARGIGELGDANFDGAVDLADLNAVRNHFGETAPSNHAVPEPSAFFLIGICFCCAASLVRPQRGCRF